ncbi:MAG: hypothetical protein HY821_07925 [Acidobacteria bacterium]|nr:hypothetical protein [Acidobacteriota bacterium]
MDFQEPSSQPASESVHGSAYLWEPPGRALSLYIDFDVVDRLGFEIMRGFGQVPRRGAEVGGILLGSAEATGRTVIRIEDFVPVACEHARGPSYILSPADRKTFEETLERWAPAPDKRIYAIGYYRSNTRDSIQLEQEDIDLVDSLFPEMTAACLLVKPYATRVSQATCITRVNGRLPMEPAEDLFPFRRKELGGGKPVRRPRGMDQADPELEAAATGYSPLEEQPAAAPDPPALPDAAIAAASMESTTPAARSRFRGGWFWIPLSFVFLLLGVVLGFQIALSYHSQQGRASVPEPYALELSAVQFGDNLHLKWNTEAAAFRSAKRGVLHIQDGDNSKVVELRQEDLSRGGVLYRNATSNVTFRLEIFPRERVSVSESVELRLLQDHAIPSASSPETGRNAPESTGKAAPKP